MKTISTLLLGLALLLASCTSGTAIAKAHEACGAHGNPGYVGKLGSDGQSIVVGGGSSDATDLGQTKSVITTTCLLDKLDAPSSVLSRMNTTRAIDGTQDATHGNIQWRWSYHSDNGLDVLVEAMS
jgi:hypothetical protein